MPPRLTPFLANYYYHVYNRGVNRAPIFFCDENYRYLLRLLKENLVRYIHLNPVAARFVGKPQDWQYSNYIDVIGQRIGTLQDTSIVPERFPDRITYKQFVDDGLAGPKHNHELEKYLLE
jgi:hypothetical protein